MESASAVKKACAGEQPAVRYCRREPL